MATIRTHHRPHFPALGMSWGEQQRISVTYIERAVLEVLGELLRRHAGRHVAVHVVHVAHLRHHALEAVDGGGVHACAKGKGGNSQP